MHDWYDWVKDIVLPALVGLGSIAVGAVAIVVARQSHELARQVRQDEAKRDADAEQKRYRDQLFRTVEPAVLAILEHRLLLAEFFKPIPGAPKTAAPVSNVMSALNLVDAVANVEDRRVVQAVMETYEEAITRNNFKVLNYVLGGLALGLARLLAEEHNVEGLVAKTNGLVAEAVRDIASGG